MKKSNWSILSSSINDDGTIDMTASNNLNKAVAIIEARPVVDGYEIYRFDSRTGTMQEYFALVIDKPITAERLFDNCKDYLEGNQPMSFGLIKVDCGDRVFCDYCNEEFTESNEQGGIYYASYAICPHCVPDAMREASKHNESHKITKKCPQDMSFKDFVLNVLRDGDK